MIIPFPVRFQDLFRFPITLTLAFLNLFIFVLIFDGKGESTLTSSPILEQEGLILTGRIYYQYLGIIKPEQLAHRPKWIHELKAGNTDHMAVLGSYALRDSNFLEAAEDLKIHGDEIKILSWKKQVVEFKKMMKDEVLFKFGLSRFKSSPAVWITYQFSHSNWVHLISNISFLIVMGLAVEFLVGGLPLILIYLVGGMCGGLLFLILDGQGTIPMVGASASISALMAFYALAEKKKRIRYFYFIAPLPEYFGEIYLPTLLIVPFFLVLDLANLWSTPEGLGGGVAYAAHIGGAIAGFAIAIYYRLRSAPYKTEEPVVIESIQD